MTNYGYETTVGVTGDNTPEILNITLNRDPSLVCEIKCYETPEPHPIVWKDGDLFQLGLRGNVGVVTEYTSPIGFWFEGVKDGEVMKLSMCYSLDGINIIKISMKDLNMNQKYRLEITTDSSEGIVMFNVYEVAGQTRPNGSIVSDLDEKNYLQMVALLGTTNPANITVKPLYIYILGDGSTSSSPPTGEQIQFFIYRYNCKWVRVLPQ